MCYNSTMQEGDLAFNIFQNYFLSVVGRLMRCTVKKFQKQLKILRELAVQFSMEILNETKNEWACLSWAWLTKTDEKWL